MLRVAAGVSTGAAGCAGGVGLLAMRTSLPAAWFGKTVSAEENPGVLPSTELAVAPITRS